MSRMDVMVRAEVRALQPMASADDERMTRNLRGRIGCVSSIFVHGGGAHRRTHD